MRHIDAWGRAVLILLVLLVVMDATVHRSGDRRGARNRPFALSNVARGADLDRQSR
ncbi:MAG: hypothetical protein ABJD97_12855 [Betaproteobacteria bacterium]